MAILSAIEPPNISPKDIPIFANNAENKNTTIYKTLAVIKLIFTRDSQYKGKAANTTLWILAPKAMHIRNFFRFCSIIYLKEITKRPKLWTV